MSEKRIVHQIYCVAKVIILIEPGLFIVMIFVIYFTLSNTNCYRRNSENGNR